MIAATIVVIVVTGLVLLALVAVSHDGAVFGPAPTPTIGIPIPNIKG